jgi:hypothetical protein
VRRAPAVLAGLGALALVGGVSACGSQTGTAAGGSAGKVVEAAGQSSGTAATVVVPTGALALSIGAPRDSVPADDTADDTALKATSGMTWVPVSWDFDLGQMPWSGQLVGDDPLPTSISLVADGQDYAVGSPYHVSGVRLGEDPDNAFYVQVPTGAAQDLQVRVTYDGGTQTVAADGTVSGSGAALADLGTALPGSVPCGDQGWTTTPADVDATLDCSVDWAGATPYFPGVGWAPEGQQLWVANVSEARLTKATQGGETYDVSTIADHSTIGGATPAEPLVQQDAPREYVAGGVLVAAVPDGTAPTLQLDLDFGLTAETSDPVDLEATTTVPLGG